MKLLFWLSCALVLSVGQAWSQVLCPPLPKPPAAPKATVSEPAKPAAPIELRVERSEGSTPTLLFLGDSLTAGAGASSANHRLPYLVSQNFPSPRGFVSYTRGGATSTTIVDLFQHLEVPEDAVFIIWVGRNNIDQPDIVVGDIRRAVRHIGDHRYMVLSVLRSLHDDAAPGTPGYAKFEHLNNKLAAAFPENFAAVGSLLVCSDRHDNTHPNDQGYTRIAKEVADELKRRGW